jgi:hypothetical protein
MQPILETSRSALLLAACVTALGSGVAHAQGNHAQGNTVVERMISQQNPCRALRVNVLGMNVALDRLDDLEVTSFEVSILRDDMIAEVLGRLSCSASSGSMAQGDIQASIRLFASLDLATCTATGVTVSLSQIAGSFGDVLLGLQPDMEAAMASELSQQIVAECREITPP